MDSGQADSLTHAIAKDWQTAGLSDADKALCQFAAALTAQPQQMAEAHILELRQSGFDDSAIHDAAQVISYFNYINRIADSLNVDLEPHVHAWELDVPK